MIVRLWMKRRARKNVFVEYSREHEQTRAYPSKVPDLRTQGLAPCKSTHMIFKPNKTFKAGDKFVRLEGEAVPRVGAYTTIRYETL
jgi:hypothetical protein